MPDALIGHTGFVGGNLAAQHPFNTWYNSKNIEAVRGKMAIRLAAQLLEASAAQLPDISFQQILT